MKKLLVLLMALIMSVSILSACKKDSGSEEEKQIVKDIVSLYVESSLDGDIDAHNFVADEAKRLQITGEMFSKQRIMRETFENVLEIPDDRLEEVVEIRNQALQKYLEMFSYEIIGTKVGEGKADVTVKLKSPDISRVLEYKDYADEESKKGFTQEELEKITGAKSLTEIPKETFLEVEKLWFEAFVKIVGDTVSEKKITFELKSKDEGWFIVGETSKKVK